LTLDNHWADSNPNTSDWLSLSSPDVTGIPPGDVPTGIEIVFLAGTHGNPDGLSPPAGTDTGFEGNISDIPVEQTTYTLEVALSKDGVNPVGGSKFVDIWSFAHTRTIGSSTDLWQGSWTRTEVNSLCVLFRRPSTTPFIGSGYSEDTVKWRRLDYGKANIYHSFAGGSLVAERESVKQKILFGKETVHGTIVPCTNRFMGLNMDPQMQGEWKNWRPQGNKNETLQMLMREWAVASVTGLPTYDELGYLLASAISIPQSTGGVAGNLNTHVFRFDQRFEQDIATYTVEYGTPDSRASRVPYGFFDSWGMSFDRSAAALTGAFLAQRVADGITMSPGVSEVQQVTFTGTPTGGTFKLRFKGAETAAITYSATPATLITNMTAALVALATIGASGVVITNPSGVIYSVTFSGSAMTSMQQPMMELSNNSLTGGSSPTATISELTAGGFIEDPLIPILPGHISIYLADTYASLSSNKLTRARLASINFTNRAAPYWVLDATQTSFLKHVETPFSMKFNLELQADSNGMGLLTNARAGSAKFMRIQGVGPLISGSDNHQFTLDTVVKVSAFGNLSDNEGVYQVNYELTAGEDEAWGNSSVITLQNGKINYN
jgi:hypothetical protein